MKYCKNCGRELSDSAMFCQSCGGLASADDSATIVEEYNIKERKIGLCIIFTIFTFGIYGLFWFVKLNDEILKLSREDGQKGIIVLILTIMTFGLYGYYWVYKMGNCVDEIKESSDVKTGFIYMIFQALGLGIVNYALIQDAINNKINSVR